MSYLAFKDISQWQGNYNMSADKNSIIAIKMSGGDVGLYMDSHATANYRNAIATGKTVIGYHFAGGKDPIAEADYFLRAMSPLAENDVYALDWEVSHPDPVGWVLKFVNHVHDKIGVWPLVYMNISTANAHDWSPVFKHCGYWCAAPSYSFDAKLPVKYPQVAQQGPIVNGIDTDAWFGTLAQLKAYGYHAPKPVPAKPEAPTPVTPPPAPAPIPVEVVPAKPSEPVIPAPAPAPEPTPAEPQPEPAPKQANKSPQTVKQTSQWGWLIRFIKWLLSVFK